MWNLNFEHVTYHPEREERASRAHQKDITIKKKGILLRAHIEFDVTTYVVGFSPFILLIYLTYSRNL